MEPALKENTGNRRNATESTMPKIAPQIAAQPMEAMLKKEPQMVAQPM